jgi:hypothetical protein
LLLGRHRLVAKEEDAMFGQGRLQYLNGRFVQWLGQVEAAHFRATLGRHVCHYQILWIHHLLTAAKKPTDYSGKLSLR